LLDFLRLRITFGTESGPLARFLDLIPLSFWTFSFTGAGAGISSTTFSGSVASATSSFGSSSGLATTPAAPEAFFFAFFSRSYKNRFQVFENV